MDKLYCCVCQKEVEFVVVEKPVTYYIDCVYCTINELQSHCKNCGEELWNEEQNIINQERFEEEMKRKEVI